MYPVVPKAISNCTSPIGHSLRKEIDWMNPLPKDLKRGLPDPCLFIYSIFLFIQLSDSSFLQAGSSWLSSPLNQVVKSPAVLIFRVSAPQFYSSHKVYIPYLTLHPILLPWDEQLSNRGVMSSAKPLENPGHTVLQGAAHLSDQKSKRLFSDTSSCSPTPHVPGPRHKLNPKILLHQIQSVLK